MPRKTRSDDWGFPRWRGYGSSRETVKVRLCDRHGCTNPGDRPAPKAPNSPERWWFCLQHAAEYNANWDYFQGLTAEEIAEREANERRDASGFQESKHYGWGAPGDGSRSRDEMRALDVLGLESDAEFEGIKARRAQHVERDVLGLESDAEFEGIKAAWRTLAKENHPDVRPGDEEAAKRFQAVQTAYEVLRAAEERRMAL